MLPPSVTFNQKMGEPLAVNPKVRPNYTRVRLEDSNAQAYTENLMWNQDHTSVKFNSPNTPSGR